MLNLLWAVFCIVGIACGILNGRAAELTQAVLDGGKEAVELAFTMAGILAMWSGILKIGERAGLMDALAKKLSPLLHLLFPDIPPSHPARRYIAANFAANFLGLGWAATPAGLNAIQAMQSLNREKDRASNAMCMFLVINMSSLQLITVNIIAYRSQYGSASPAEITALGIAATCVSTLSGILAVKLLERRW